MRAVGDSRALKVGILLAFAAIVVPALLYKLPMLVGADAAYIVLSGSMEPTFAPGDVIFIDEVPAEDLRVGDVVTIKPSVWKDTLVTHRIVEVVRDGPSPAFRLKGDANEDVDTALATPEQVMGKYSFRIPYWGLLASVLKTPAGYFAFVLVPGLSIVAFEFVRLYRELDAWDRARREPMADVAFEVVGVRQ